MSVNEIISLKQCIKILQGYPIIFVGPISLNTKKYEELCENFLIKRFNDKYFEDIDGYNRLMLSPAFYKVFLNYKFVLIHQLDAYVFKDDLQYWCDQNYDFIGAPNFPHENKANEFQFLKGYSKILNLANKMRATERKLSNVGNGGFSLRKTNSCHLLLKLLKTKVNKWGKNNEDGFFKYWGNILHPIFRLPTDEKALTFSIELSPAESLEKLNFKLPFGCHAFSRYEPETWKKYINF